MSTDGVKSNIRAFWGKNRLLKDLYLLSSEGHSYCKFSLQRHLSPQITLAFIGGTCYRIKTVSVILGPNRLAIRFTMLKYILGLISLHPLKHSTHLTGCFSYYSTDICISYFFSRTFTTCIIHHPVAYHHIDKLQTLGRFLNSISIIADIQPES
jgi:hypothetical protein